MKILLIDDHVSFCEGLIAALGTIRDDYAVDFESDAQLIPESLIGKLDYDLFIMDLMMPGLGGIELIRYLNKLKNETPIIVMSSVQDITVVKQVYQLGIIGYIPKSYGVYDIVNAIEQCRQGDIHVPPFFSEFVEEISTANKPTTAQETGQTSSGKSLTKRQLQIVSLMDKGLSNQEIADALFISKATVKTHLNQLFKLLEVNNRIGCLRAAKKLGLSVIS